jgi:hypothetical protein
VVAAALAQCGQVQAGWGRLVGVCRGLAGEGPEWMDSSGRRRAEQEPHVQEALAALWEAALRHGEQAVADAALQEMLQEGGAAERLWPSP